MESVIWQHLNLLAWHTLLRGSGGISVCAIDDQSVSYLNRVRGLIIGHTGELDRYRSTLPSFCCFTVVIRKYTSHLFTLVSSHFSGDEDLK